MNVEMLACEKEFAMSNNQPAEIVDKMFLASPEPIEDVGVGKIDYVLSETDCSNDESHDTVKR